MKLAVTLLDILLTEGQVKHLRVSVLVVRTEEVLWLAGWCGAVPVPPAVVSVGEPARPHLRAVDVLLRRAAVRRGGGGGGVVAVLVAFVTFGTAGTVGEILIVTPIIRQVVHLGVSLLVIGTDEVLRWEAWVTAPVSPAVVRVRVVTPACRITVNSLVWGGAVGLGCCGGDGWGAVNIPVRAGSVSAVHV